ncbi:hypothetical protein CEW92_14140 [Bacillaceae bacterium SAS-127]|nr:hypothetical protein CEW92_14140 [Bacillaceae bacterium SAS-127]
MSEIWNGFADRAKRLAPIWQFGRGMRLGELDEYIPNILLATFLEIFYRELNDDARRTIQDLELIVKGILRKMKLKSVDNQVQRLVFGMLFSGAKELQKPFVTVYFDEEDEEFKELTYRYLEPDRVYSHWSSDRTTVYRLTEQGQEIVFMSREISQELNITIEQLFTLQLIKNKNFEKAKESFRTLLARVRILYHNERELQEEIKQNPKIILQQSFEKRRERESDIKKQFFEEKQRFEEIHRLLLKAKDTANLEDADQQIEELLIKVEETRRMHDRLATVVTENHALELEMRVKHPELFWHQALFSFKKDIWEDLFLYAKQPYINEMDRVLMPFFSPRSEFILPLDWLWQEHEITMDQGEEEQLDDGEDEEKYQPKVTDWNHIARLWKPIFDDLLSFGEFSILELQDVTSECQQEWLLQKEAFELWMMFAAQPVEFTAEALRDEADERVVLLKRLIESDLKYQKLLHTTIVAEPIHQIQKLVWKDVEISPFRLVVKERL